MRKTLAVYMGALSSFRFLFTGCFIVFTTLSLQAKMFIWKDAQGNQHVTDTPPPKESTQVKSIGSDNNSKPPSLVESFVPGRSPSAEVQAAYQNLTRCGPYKYLQEFSSGGKGPTDIKTFEFESKQRVWTIETNLTQNSQTKTFTPSRTETGYYDGYFYRQKKNGQFVRTRLTGNNVNNLGFLWEATMKITGTQAMSGVKFLGRETLNGYKCAVYTFETPVNMLRMTLTTKLWVRLDGALPLREEVRSINDIITNYEYPESLRIPPPPPRIEEVPFSDFFSAQ